MSGEPRQQPHDPLRRVSQRLGSRDRMTWRPGGVPGQLSPVSPPCRAQLEPIQPEKQLEDAASPAQAANQPDPVLNRQPAPRRKRTRPVRPAGVQPAFRRMCTRPVRPAGVQQQMTDTESEKEGATPAADSVMAGNKHTATHANSPSNEQQAAERPSQPDSDEDSFMRAHTTDRTGQPSSHQPVEASSSGLPDSNTGRAAATQQKQGKGRLRTAGGRLIGKAQPATGTHADAGRTASRKGTNSAVRQPSRSSFSFDRTPEADDVEATLSDPAAPTRHAK